MKEKIAAIRTLLDELQEAERYEPAPEPISGLELPDLIRDIVDLLFPLLTPYQVAIYMYMFRQSIGHDGQPFVLVSRRGLMSGVVRSPYADRPSRLNGSTTGSDNAASYNTIQDALAGLVRIGAIRQEAEPNREGTRYRVFTPSEIAQCQEIARSRLLSQAEAASVKEGLIDYYNIRENRLKVFERDSYLCRYCSKLLTQSTATLDHIQPVSRGGDHSLDNLVTSCLNCNSQKNNRKVGDFLAEADPTR